MILCAERFDRELPSSPAPGATFPKCPCDSQGLFAAESLAGRQADLRMSGAPILLTRGHGRRVARRARITAAQGG